jgi:hypothetical protein
MSAKASLLAVTRDACLRRIQMKSIRPGLVSNNSYHDYSREFGSHYDFELNMLITAEWYRKYYR